MIKARTETVPYIGTSALVEALLVEGERGQKTESIIEKGGSVSALTIDELLWVAKKLGRKDFISITHYLLMHQSIEFVSVLSTNSLRASELMEQYGLKPRDAMHVAIMQDIGATEIVSNNPDFDKIPGIKRITLSD